jgi:hypothetical protein
MTCALPGEVYEKKSESPGKESSAKGVGKVFGGAGDNRFQDDEFRFHGSFSTSA